MNMSICMIVCMYTVHASSDHGGQKRVLGPLELELWTSSCALLCGCLDLDLGSLQEQQVLLLPNHLCSSQGPCNFDPWYSMHKKPRLTRRAHLVFFPRAHLCDSVSKKCPRLANHFDRIRWMVDSHHKRQWRWLLREYGVPLEWGSFLEGDGCTELRVHLAI